MAKNKRPPSSVELDQMRRIANKSKEELTWFKKFNYLIGKKEEPKPKAKPKTSKAKTIMGVFTSDPFGVRQEKNRTRAKVIVGEKKM